MSNLTNNRISATLTEEAYHEIVQCIQKIETLLPFLVGLTISEKKKMPKINAANKNFVEDVIQVNELGAELLPAFLHPKEVEKDFALYQKLDSIYLRLAEMSEKVQDTKTIAGSEAYSAALQMYRAYKMAAQSGIPGADTFFDILKKRFETHKRNTPT